VPDDDTTTAEDPQQPQEGQPPAEDPKGDDLSPDALRKQLEKARREAASYRTKAKELEPLARKAQEMEEATRSDLEKAVAAARKETEETVRAEVRRERVLDRIEVLAAKDFADPEDARLRLGQRADEFVDKDGAVDAQAISVALADLLKTRPHLAAAQPDGRPRGNADIGARDTAPKRAQSLEDAVMARVAPPR
jgi:hypothetical protein